MNDEKKHPLHTRFNISAYFPQVFLFVPNRILTVSWPKIFQAPEVRPTGEAETLLRSVLYFECNTVEFCLHIIAASWAIASFVAEIQIRFNLV